MEDDALNGNPWHLDKRVSLSVIFSVIGLVIAMFIQTIYTTSIITEYQVTTENRLAQLEATDKTRDNHEARLIILEQKFNFIQESLSRIEKRLERAVP